MRPRVVLGSPSDLAGLLVTTGARCRGVCYLQSVRMGHTDIQLGPNLRDPFNNHAIPCVSAVSADGNAPYCHGQGFGFTD